MLYAVLDTSVVTCAVREVLDIYVKVSVGELYSIFGLVIIKNPQLLVNGVEGELLKLVTSANGAFKLKTNDWLVADFFNALPAVVPLIALVDETKGSVFPFPN